MSLKIFSQAPYYDDYDEAKRYLRVLFRPAVSLQVRELNQLQTYLQTQVERVGLHLFKEGSMVIPGQSSVDTNVTYIKIENETNGVDINTIAEELIGSTITGQTSGVTARVTTVTLEEPNEDNPSITDAITLFVRYTSSGDDNETKTFVAGELLVADAATTTTLVERTVQIKSGSGVLGKGTIASIQNGIYFVKGQFALVTDQTLVISKYSNTPSFRIGLDIDENIVDSNDDSTLADNANGVPNQNAPGAHRYQIILTLTKLAPDSILDDTFIELIRITDGVLQSRVTETDYSILAKTLARRTYDESGHYTVSPFKVAVREHRNNDRGAWSGPGTTYQLGDIVTSGGNYFVALKAGLSGAIEPSTLFDATDPYQNLNDGIIDWNYTQNPPFNRGYLTAENGGDESAIAVAIEPGKAYVQGYEVEKIATEYVKVSKARTFDRISNDAIPVSYGNYVYVSNVLGLPDCSTFPQVDLHNQLTPSSNPQTAGAGTKVGTARLRGWEFHSGTPGTSTGVYKAYIFDVKMESGYTFDRDVKQIFYDSGTTKTNIAADVYGKYTTLSGFISASTTTITGSSGTAFTTQLKVDDYIRTVNSTGAFEFRRVTAITDNDTLTIDSAFSGTVSGAVYSRVGAEINEPGGLPLIFPLAYSFIRNTRGGTGDNEQATTYTTTQRFDASTGSGQTSLTFSVGSATSPTTIGSEFNPAATSTDYILVNRTDGTIESPSGITLQNNGVDVLVSGLTASKAYSLLAPVRKAGSPAQEKKKTLIDNATADFTTLASVTPLTLSLGKADGYRIVTIRMAEDFTAASSNPATTTDITSWFTFDNGQRDTHYDVATIKRKEGYPVPSGAVRVIFDYFDHSIGTAGDYFTVNSYSGEVPYNKIPYYISSTGVVALSDVMDFRPRIGDGGVLFSGTGASQTEIPKIGFETSASYSYYLPRSDKLALNIDGAFFSVDGVASLSPEEPKDPSLGMLIAKLHISAYTLFPSQGSVQIETIDTKRYTMRDIGKLDKRIENLEYYTALSLLEQETKSLTIQDELGLDRFKNGFIVDSFKGSDLGDTASVDYRCSIDMTAQELRPFYTMDNVNLLETNQSDLARDADGYALTGDIITLPYTERELVRQQFASRTENVNPFAIFTFLGSMSLNPPSDEWFEVDRRPDIVNNIEGNFTAVQTALEATGALGTVWGAWETNWVGQTRNIDRLVVTRGFDSRDYGLGAARWSDRRTFTQAELQAIGGDATSFGNAAAGARVLTFQTQATTVGQSRTGIQTSVTPKIDYQVLEDRVLQSALIPYIRSRDLLFVCKGLKPNTKLFPFFDDTDISLFVTPATKVNLALTAGTTDQFNSETNVGGAAEEFARQVDGKAEVSYNKGDVVFVKQRGATTYNTQAVSPGTGIAVLVEKSTGDPQTEAVYLMNIKGSFQDGDIIRGSISGTEYEIDGSVVVATEADDVITNFNGSVAGVFKIPNTDSIRFRTGIREFKLSDSSTGSLDFTTQGRAQYRAQGILETKQKTINAVRNAEIATQQVSESQITEVYSDERLTRDTGWYDPLAQTFLVQSTGGAFITSVDVFFATKDIGIPVTLQIREVVNGYPGQRVLPFSRVTLTPDKINLDPNIGSEPTTFRFESPVYLQDLTEYCIVLLSDSNNYRVWIAQLGEKAINSDRFISEQPYAGVLFKSQNASTWTANQEQDLKFTIRSAVFDIAQNPVVEFNNEPLPPIILETDPFQTKNGTSKVRVFAKNHAMPNNSSVIISNVAAGTYNGIVTTSSTGLNGTFIVVDSEIDSFVIDVGSNATNSGFVGGENVVATVNIGYDAVNFIAQSQVFSETTLAFGMTPINESYSAASAETSLIPNITTYFDNKNIIASQTNENLSALSGNKSLVVTARLTSDNENLSPVIDTSRMSLTTISNKIDTYTYSTKNNDDLDYKVVLTTAGNNVSYSGSTISIANTGSLRSDATGIAVGKYIDISGTGSGTNNTTDPILVTAVASDGSTITCDHTFTTQSATTTTITLLDNFVNEIAPTGGSSESKYVTRVVNLANSSTFLKIMFGANIPAVTGSDIEVYYKLLPAGSTTDITKFNFVKATPTANLIKTSNRNTFTDVTYELEDLPVFDAVVIKIVFKTGNSAQVPRVKDLRVIACA